MKVGARSVDIAILKSIAAIESEPDQALANRVRHLGWSRVGQKLRQFPAGTKAAGTVSEVRRRLRRTVKRRAEAADLKTTARRNRFWREKVARNR